MLTLDDLRLLGRGRWLVMLLTLLLERDGARFAEMLIGLAIARDSLVRTLELAITHGWVMRNPGHGHPLRPEYVLTARGRVVAAACARMLAVRARLGIAPETMPRWSLPIIGHLRLDWARFSELRRELLPITPRALSLTLKQMIEGGLVGRRVEEGFPPSALYGLAQNGRELLSSLLQA